MKYWLTTHWPPLTDGVPIPLGVWLEDGKAGAADGMECGDLLLIHQVESGESVVKAYADGSVTAVPRFPGKKGLVTVAEIIDKPSEHEECGEETYADGSKRWWRYLALAKPINSAGFVAFQEVIPLVGSLRAIGKQHSGLKELSEDVFRQLLEKYQASTIQPDAATKDQVSRQRGFGPGGEGSTHLALKMAISQDPSRILGEAGLTLWQLEYGLPTADKVDVVLKDRFGRFVVVEVEVDCDETEVIGPLQCMKYRALICYLHRRRTEEVRAVLAAHSIDLAVEATCKEFNIECRIVARSAIATAEVPRAS